MSEGEVLQLRQYGKGGYVATRGQIHNAIMQGLAFKSGAMTGTEASGLPTWGYGRLDDKYRASVQSADYIVWSYGTPIAWHITEGDNDWWVFPDDTYSATTNRHQSITRTALVLAKVLPYDEDPSEQE